MSRSLTTIATLTGLLLAAIAPQAAVAAFDRQPASDRPALEAMMAPMAEGISLDAAIRKVKNAYGKVTILKAQTKGRNGKRVHQIKFLTDSGRVRTVRVDARTGEFI